MQDGTIHLWFVTAGTTRTVHGFGAKVALTGWSANGRLLAASAGGSIHVIAITGGDADGDPVALDAHTARVTQLAWQPQGPCLASGARDRRLR